MVEEAVPTVQAVVAHTVRAVAAVSAEVTQAEGFEFLQLTHIHTIN